MDNRLSQLDQRLHEISAKITISSSTQTKQVEKPIEVLDKIQAKKIEPKVESQRENNPAQKQKVEIQNEIEPQSIISEIQSEKTQEWLPPMEIPTYEKHRMVELSTLTEITNKVPQFPAELIRFASQIEPQIPEKITEPEVIQEPILVAQSNIQEIKEIIPELIIKPEVVQHEPEKKIQTSSSYQDS